MVSLPRISWQSFSIRRGADMRTTLILAVVLIVVYPAAARGQSQITTAAIDGIASDATGAALPGVTVEARNVDTNFARAAVTSSDGRFAILQLPPGRYKVTFTLAGFAELSQDNLELTVGQTVTLSAPMKVSGVSETVTVSQPAVEVTRTASASTLNQTAVESTPILGRKFEDLLTLTPGVSIVQGADGDEITFAGQRGTFNNISLDGGDYNNGFFGEQAGGQRAAIDITLEAVKEFQVIASGANAEFGRTAGGVVNVITKSGTNTIHGSLFEYFRDESLTAAASGGTPLTGFRRNQFGGTLRGPVKKDKLLLFLAAEGIMDDLTRANLSAPLGTACGASNPVFNSTITDAEISASPDCQRQTLLNYFQNNFGENEGLPVDHIQRNASVFGRADLNLNAKTQLFFSYSFDRSNNPNQTFDVPTYGTTANGIEGASHIQSFNVNGTSSITNNVLNEAHFTYSRETRPRAAVDKNSVPDTAMGFFPNFRFGQPFFLEP